MISTETINTRQAKNQDNKDSSGLRGGRRIASRSGCSKAKAKPNVLDVAILIQSTCAGVSGKVNWNRMAAITTSASPPLVGSMNSTNLRILS